jgi:two-component system, NtrC family, sensor kinase
MSDLSQPWAVQAAASAAWLEAAAVPMCLCGEHRPLQANSALLRLTGIEPDALPGLQCLSLVVPEDRAALAEALAACLTGSGDPPAQSARLQARYGERPVELTLRRITLDDGPAALITCVDLSDFQHVQSMLLGMSSMLRQIVNGAPVASYVIDREHRITHWNHACEKLTGCTADEMIGSTEHWRAFHACARPTLADMIVDGIDPIAGSAALGDQTLPSQVVAGAFEKEAFFPGADGAEGRWLHFTVAPLHDAERQVAGAIVTLQDVTQHRRTQEQLTRQLELLVTERSAELAAHVRQMDAFIDNAPFGVVYTVNDKVQRANRRMAEIFGPVGPQEDGGSGAGAFHIEPEEAHQLRKIAQPLFARNEPLHHEMWMKHRQGHPLWIQINAFPIEFSDDTTGAWWMLQDRTEVRTAQEELRTRFEELQSTNRQLEQAQNQLLQSDKMASIGQLAAGVAHEINNPVGFVSSNLHSLRLHVQSLLALVEAHDLARASPGDPALEASLAQTRQDAELEYLKEDLPQLLDESADGLARVKKIVQDLKDFSRVDQSDWQEADLIAGLESTLNVVRNEIKYKAEVQRRLTPIPAVLCLAGQLNQVFLNLIVNASHAIAEQGVITLSSGSEGDWVWIQVDDNGCGMSEEVQRRVFEPFYTTKDVGKGTGLGLSLSFSIVQKHGGAIQVRSQLGQGSAFRIWVPIHGPQPHLTPPTWT